MVEFSDEAISDLIKIRDWIARDAPERANQNAKAIIETCKLLDTVPKLGRERHDGTRKFTKIRWVIIYELTSTGPYIIHIWDSSQNWQS